MYILSNNEYAELNQLPLLLTCVIMLKSLQKNVPGVLKRFWGVWGAPHPHPGVAGSENDTLLPMTMTCDRLKFWSGPAWRSKVIIRKPWRRKNKKNKNKK